MAGQVDFALGALLGEEQKMATMSVHLLPKSNPPPETLPDRGGTAHCYNHWIGHGLPTSTGRIGLPQVLATTRLRVIWFAPPCGADSPLQHFNLCFPEGVVAIHKKQTRAQRIQTPVFSIYLSKASHLKLCVGSFRSSASSRSNSDC